MEQTEGRRGRRRGDQYSAIEDDDVLQGARYSAIHITTILSYDNDTNGSTQLGEKPRADQGERTGPQVGMDVASGRYITCVLPSAVLNAPRSSLPPLRFTFEPSSSFQALRD